MIMKNLSASPGFIHNTSKQNTFLICGGAGFIGSNIINNLLKIGHKVIAIDDLSSGNLDNIKHFAQNPNFEFIKDKFPNTKLEIYFAESDFVIQLASRVGVEIAVKSPTELMTNNLLATAFVISMCHKYNKPIFVSSSSEIYGKYERDDLSENDYSYIGFPSLLRWSYSVSKISEEFITYEFKHKGLKALIGRYFNFIGKNQNNNYGFVVPRFINQALSNNPITVYGDGSQRRTFCDIRDGINGIFSLIDNFSTLCELDNISYNIGGKTDISILELAQVVKLKTSSNSEIIFMNSANLPYGFDEIKKRKPNCSLIYNSTNWEAIYSLEDTLNLLLDE